MRKISQVDQKKGVRGTVAATVIVACLASVVWYSNRQNTLAAPNQSFEAHLKAQRDAQSARALLQGEHKTLTITHAKFLRDRWRPWALSHQNELRRMLKAKPDDQASLMAVWNVLPRFRGSDAMSQPITPNDLITGGLKFSWNAGRPPKPVGNDPERQLAFHRMEATQKWSLQNNFKEVKDIQLSQSINTGTTIICLWASGRVTESTVNLDSPVDIDNRTSAFHLKHQEIMPPYDFLQSVNTS